MIRLVGWAMGLSLVLAGAIGAARALGRGQPTPPSLVQLRLMACAPPCWVGIIPGQSTIKQAKARLIAAYDGQPNLQIRDSGFADGYVAPNVVENMVETDDLYLSVRMNFDTLIDGENEIVQSIGLYELSGKIARCTRRPPPIFWALLVHRPKWGSINRWAAAMR